jgi:hypothetical protein
MRRNRLLIRALGAMLTAALLPATAGARAAEPGDAGLAHLDGYLHANGGCLMLQQHDGHAYALVGGTAGLLSGDHVKLDGRFVRNPGCGASGFEVKVVRSVWADDDHRNAYFDWAKGETFLHYAERSGRLEERDAAALAGAPGAAAEERTREAAPPAPPEARAGEGVRVEGRDREGTPDRDRASADRREGASAERREPEGARAERPDREGRHVYKGTHHKATFVGTLHEAAGGCPSLHTAHRVFALDGDLRTYQAGDSVKISGELYEQDPDGPCGGPTLLITSIRGH